MTSDVFKSLLLAQDGVVPNFDILLENTEGFVNSV